MKEARKKDTVAAVRRFRELKLRAIAAIAPEGKQSLARPLKESIPRASVCLAWSRSLMN